MKRYWPLITGMAALAVLTVFGLTNPMNALNLHVVHFSSTSSTCDLEPESDQESIPIGGKVTGSHAEFSEIIMPCDANLIAHVAELNYQIVLIVTDAAVFDPSELSVSSPCLCKHEYRFHLSQDIQPEQKLSLVIRGQLRAEVAPRL